MVPHTMRQIVPKLGNFFKEDLSARLVQEEFSKELPVSTYDLPKVFNPVNLFFGPPHFDNSHRILQHLLDSKKLIFLEVLPHSQGKPIVTEFLFQDAGQLSVYSIGEFNQKFACVSAYVWHIPSPA